MNKPKPRPIRFCAACGKPIPTFLRTDKRTCSGSCRQWVHSHPPGTPRPGSRRAPLPKLLKKEQRPPTTLSQALLLLAKTRVYARKVTIELAMLRAELAAARAKKE